MLLKKLAGLVLAGMLFAVPANAEVKEFVIGKVYVGQAPVCRTEEVMKRVAAPLITNEKADLEEANALLNNPAECVMPPGPFKWRPKRAVIEFVDVEGDLLTIVEIEVNIINDMWAPAFIVLVGKVTAGDPA